LKSSFSYLTLSLGFLNSRRSYFITIEKETYDLAIRQLEMQVLFFSMLSQHDT
jgi:hypothetical protein